MSFATSIHDKVGQLVCGGFQGTTVTPQAYELIVKHKVSTMILLRKNAHSVEQMQKLIRDLQFIAFKHANYEYPLAFAIDEEGGMLNSLFDPQSLVQFPGAMALAALGNPDLVYEVLRALAVELKHIGFLIILGPVLDVITKLSHQLVSVRSFGTTVDEVTKYGKACAQGFRDGGLVTVGKHFPGIGNANVDSLPELPVMTDSLDQIKRFNSVPFAELINEGLLDGISAAGCGVPNIAPEENHACLLPVLLTQVLRKEFGFQGFVISECLEMEALYHSIGLGQGVVLAVYAGCDLVMVCHDFALQVEAIESLQSALSNGLLDELIITASLSRIEKVQKTLPKWSELFPTGEMSETPLFKDANSSAWEEHQALSCQAYRNSITLVRDYEGAIPLSLILPIEEPGNLLVLTPLLNPVYPEQSLKEKEKLYTGEEVFKKFGEILAKHPLNKGRYNVLHATYTANGLTPLHELLIENSKAVIVLTSEALRNMYQIGIVKYVSILCGASPLSLSQIDATVLLAKPLILVATSSPYDFFYNKSIGLAYLCCYDYTENALQELAAVIVGDFVPQGCIPGEKKFIQSKPKKRRSLSVASSPDRLHLKIRKPTPPKRRWLVDELDVSRDWRGLVKLLKDNLDLAASESYFRLLVPLLHGNLNTQKHFVVRNSSLNILYGVALTWVQDLSTPDNPDTEKAGLILLVVVDKLKRLQLIGTNLHSRAVRYLFKEQQCHTVQLGNLFPLLEFCDDVVKELKNVSFFNHAGWDITDHLRPGSAHAMVLRELSAWSVPQKIFRELTIVGVRFDICTQAEKLSGLIDRTTGTGSESHRCRQIRHMYREAVSSMSQNSLYEVKIIIALEPTNQSVIGSIILFTNKSQFARYYPFMDQAQEPGKTQLVGGLASPVIDPSYLNLTEIFKCGLICSGITYLRSNFNDLALELRMNLCLMMDVAEDKSYSGVEDIGFKPWRRYSDFYDRLSDVATMTGEN